MPEIMNSDPPQIVFLKHHISDAAPEVINLNEFSSVILKDPLTPDLVFCRNFPNSATRLGVRSITRSLPVFVLVNSPLTIPLLIVALRPSRSRSSHTLFVTHNKLFRGKGTEG